VPVLRSACAVLNEVATNGWGDSNVTWSRSQEYPDAPCLYQGSCSGRGENTVGKCFCAPGFTGEHCELADTTPVPPCTHHDDRCFYSPVSGVMAISVARWLVAQRAEGAWAANSAQKTAHSKLGDRVEEHMRDFGDYRSVAPDGANLGVTLELGAGPWTQSVWMLRARKYSVSKLVLLDPGAMHYSREVKSSLYRSGEVDIGAGGVVRPVVINAGAEDIDFIRGTIDTLVMINVLEHVLNAPVILRAIFNALKPGGVLIFNDRWWDAEGPPGATRGLLASHSADMQGLDVIFHPVRLRLAVIDQFLSGFSILHEARNEASASFKHRKYNGTYFIGRKKRLC
jgi:SAM-dependent methyltransferase